jgi:tetratricopeptide (TPR) repeat protein
MNKLFLVILACICFGIYIGYLNNSFVFDDKILVEANPLIKSARLLPNVFRTGIYEYWTGGQPYDRMYRPLQMLSYYLDYTLWGVNPAAFRFSNLILHLLNSILVFYLIVMIFKNNLLAQASSILFLVHPVHISTVAYISSRGDLLSGFFILASCILFLRFLDSSDYWFYFLSILAAVFALLSRENALLIFFFLALLGSLGPREKIKLKSLAGFFVLCLVYLGVRFIALGPSGLATHPVYLKGLLGLVNFCNIIFRYILLLLYPHDLRMFHSTAFIYKLTLPILFLVTSGCVLSLAILISWWKKKLLRFSLLWFLLGITPVYFYFDAYPALGRALMAESWLYLPSIGFSTAFAYICLLNKKGKFIISACVLILGSMVLANRVYWRNDVVFYERAMQFLSEDNIIQKNLAAAYIQEGNFIQADKTIRRLQQYYPDSPIVNSAWGQYYLATQEPTQALNYYQRILGKSFFTNYSVSLCYSKLGDFNKAIEFSQASFSLNAFYLPNIIQLATLYKEAGQMDQANKYFILAKELKPRV